MHIYIDINLFSWHIHMGCSLIGDRCFKNMIELDLMFVKRCHKATIWNKGFGDPKKLEMVYDCFTHMNVHLCMWTQEALESLTLKEEHIVMMKQHTVIIQDNKQ